MQDQSTQTVPDDLSERLTVKSNSTPLDTPATSYSSHYSASDREAKKTGMYKLSGNIHLDLRGCIMC